MSMKSLTSIILASLTTLLLFSGPVVAASEAPYVKDSDLKAKVKRIKPKFGRFAFFLKGLDVNVVVRNRTGSELDRPYRLVIDSSRKVLNADGVTKNGLPFIWVCESACSLPDRSRSQRVKVELGKLKRRNFAWFKRRLNFSVEYEPFQMQLLHFADMDGTSGALQNVGNFSAILESLRSELPDNTLTLTSGDNYIPGPRFAACGEDALNSVIGAAGQGRCDIEFLNAMGVQASVVGNHDLDLGTGDNGGLASIISTDFGTAGGNYPGTAFPYLSANLDFSTDANLAALTAPNAQPANTLANKLAGNTIIEVDGEMIGIVGASTPTLPFITSVEGITVSPMLLPGEVEDLDALAAEIQPEVDQLTSLGIDKIILLAHMQRIAVEQGLAERLTDVDIIVAGGSNTLLADTTDLLRDGDSVQGEYPLSSVSASGEPVLIVNTDGDYKYLGRLISVFDLHGNVIESLLDASVNGAYKTDAEGLALVGNPAPNARVVEVADALTDVLAALDGNLFGASSVYLDGRRNQVRTQETNMGNLTADANLAMAQSVDPTVQVSLKNGGGIRDDIGFFAFPPGSTNPEDLEFFPTAPNPAAGKESGDVSQFDISGTLRFNNGLTLLTVTAAELQALIEHGVGFDDVGTVTGGRFPQVAGMAFSFDPALPNGSRVPSLAIVDENGIVVDTIVAGGVLQGDPNRTIRMVTLGFLAGGGDGYPFPAGTGDCGDADGPADRCDLDGSGLVTPGVASFAEDGSEQDALAEYLATNFPRVAPYNEAETPAELDGRIQNLALRVDTVLAP